ncbi:aminoacyl-tRNA deacylase [Alkalihalophilus pseudofirmus]|nr:aminoacyl-tRNA deacylase [Alkalihalophilus pseudofirmus]
MSVSKTNAMRILDANQIEYLMMSYSSEDGKIDGVSVAQKIGRESDIVYKTLVAQTSSKEYYVFLVPVDAQLDLRKAAKAVKEKKIEMIPVKDIQKLTGYIRGGCSPIGMKKLFPTFIDESSTSLGTIVVSGGKIGAQIELQLDDLVSVTKAHFADLIK